MAFETEFALLTDHIAMIEAMLNETKDLCEFASEINVLEIRIQKLKNRIQCLKDLQCDQEASLIKIARDLRIKTT